MNLLPIKGQKDLVRDTETGAVLHTNMEASMGLKLAKDKRRKEKEQLEASMQESFRQRDERVAREKIRTNRNNAATKIQTAVRIKRNKKIRNIKRVQQKLTSLEKCPSSRQLQCSHPGCLVHLVHY